MIPNPKLNQAVDALAQDMTETLQRWIRIPSVESAAQPGAPFGTEVRRMLDAALEDGKRLGFAARDVDGYACDFEIGGDGEPVAILAHLDVVPAGDDWQEDPFSGDLRDGVIHGRGTYDDKGPAVASMFAMKAIQDAGIPLKKKARLILGCDEESGWADIAYYKDKIGMPRTGFSPDADYPLIYAEKGITHLTLRAQPGMEDQATLPLYSLNAGERANVIPGNATAEIGGDFAIILAACEGFAAKHPISIDTQKLENGHTQIAITGKSGHGAAPQTGHNAAAYLIQLLAGLSAGGEKTSAILKELALTAAADYTGAGFAIDGSDGISGSLTMNLGILRFAGGELSFSLDIRYPVMFDAERIRGSIARRLAPLGFAVESGHSQDPLYVPQSSPLVQKLLSVYRGMTGDDTPPMAIGGGTYARSLQEGVAFGASFPGLDTHIHEAGESMSVEHLILNAKIIAHAIVALCGEDA